MKLSLSLSLSGFVKSVVPFVGPLDAYASGLAGAYSVSRRLLASYAGGLIRVRRDSDGTEADIGCTAAGLLDVDALLLFAGVGSAYVVTFYDQSGLGRDVTCASLSNQLRIVDNVVLEVIGPQGRPCAYSVNDYAGCYVSATFSINTSSSLTSVSSVYTGSTVPSARYMSLLRDGGDDAYYTYAIGLFYRNSAGVFNSIWNSYGYCTVNDADDTQKSVSVRLTSGGSLTLKIGGNSTTDSLGGTTVIGYNRVVLGAQGSLYGRSQMDDRHMEHVLWQTDLGATVAEDVRAEQEAFYA